MFNAALLSLVLMTPVSDAPASDDPTTVAAATVQPLAVFDGDWKIVDTESGKTMQDCKQAQSFAVSSDRKTVVLTEKWANNWTARYIVLHSEANRVLMFIEGEKRATESGDPIIWWAQFDGPDRFRWRQYDWAPDSVTTMQWQRCPAGSPQHGSKRND